MVDGEARRYAATLGRRYFEGTVTLEALFAHFGSSADPLIRALLVAAAHQPSRGFAGISEERWEREFWQPVSALLVELEKGADGEAPASRVYPRSTFLGVVGWSILSLFAIASAAEHAMRLWNLRDPATQFSVWRAVFESVGLAFMTLASWLAVRGTLYRFQLFRTRRNPYQECGRDAG